MSSTGKAVKVIVILLLAACVAAGGFYVGKKTVDEQLSEKQRQVDGLIADKEHMAELNRSSVMNMEVGEDTIYVIGHKNPDTDTVCSAKAYAYLLRLMGFDARPAVNGEMNNETKFVLEGGDRDFIQLEDATDKYIFLVDHSEYLQSTDGMPEAHIVGVLDHHGVGSLQTGNQVVYDARPIGATATIVWLTYLNYGFEDELDPGIAYELLCAILSDTANLTGSATTDADREAVQWLAYRAGVHDVDDLYAQLRERQLSYDGFTDIEILFSDYKEYEAFGTTFGIGIVNAIDEDTARELAARMKAVLPEGFASREVGLMYVDITIREDGIKTDFIVPVDDLSGQILELAIPTFDEYDGTSFIYRNGGCGRKSKLVPGLSDFLATQPHDN